MKTYSQNMILGLFLGTISSSEVTQETEGWRYIRMAQPDPNDHPYGAGYNKAIMDDPLYSDTWSHVTHPHVGNETAYVGDAPADYSVEPMAGIALYQRPSRLSQMQHR